ncbi:hypothetical protein Y032_0219g2488 [Ancylostoma ceylanicum]|uniref:Uncharacterized protein n=1 Tax=Ancylostoma ceylanicum TaxID=53326 RepID=A0A016SJU0_9BILA|nr:hypothetical protein Y032_0219g2488 [Ancylostoma ceylanicum]
MVVSCNSNNCDVAIVAESFISHTSCDTKKNGERLSPTSLIVSPTAVAFMFFCATVPFSFALALTLGNFRTVVCINKNKQKSKLLAYNDYEPFCHKSFLEIGAVSY